MESLGSRFESWRAHQLFQRVGVLCRETKGLESLDLCIAGAATPGRLTGERETCAKAIAAVGVGEERAPAIKKVFVLLILPCVIRNGHGPASIAGSAVAAGRPVLTLRRRDAI